MRAVAGALPVLLACALLAGCGFHLRGAVTLPDSMQATALQGVDPQGVLASEIEALLEAAGGKVVEPQAADSLLRIEQERFERRVASVGAGGKVSEYELNYSLGFSLLAPDGSVRVPTQTLSTARIYDFDSTNVLASASEEELIRRELRSFALRQMLRQLRTRLQHDAAVAPLPAVQPEAAPGPQ